MLYISEESGSVWDVSIAIEEIPIHLCLKVLTGRYDVNKCRNIAPVARMTRIRYENTLINMEFSSLMLL